MPGGSWLREAHGAEEVAHHGIRRSSVQSTSPRRDVSHDVEEDILVALHDAMPGSLR